MHIYHIYGPAPLMTNTFLAVDGQGTAVAVDPAAGAQQYLDSLARHGATLAAILLTHGHHDHVGAVQALKEAVGAPVYMGVEDAAGSRLLPLHPRQIDHPLQDGQKLCFGEMEFTVVRTPGHSAGSSCFLCENALFTGDTLFAGDIGRTDLDNSDPNAMAASLKKLWRLFNSRPDIQVLPGHEEFSTFGREMAQNSYLRRYGMQ